MNIRQRRGSSLLLLMVLGSFMTLLFWVLMNFMENYMKDRYAAIPRAKASLAANSVLSYWLYYRKSGQKNIEVENQPLLDRFVEKCRVVHDTFNQGDSVGEAFPLFGSAARASCPPFFSSLAHTAELTFIEQRYTDYLVAALEDLVLAGIPQDGRFFLGPIYSGGNLVIKDGGHHFFTRKEWNTRALLVGKEIKFWDKWRNYRESLKKAADRSLDNRLSLKEKKARSKELELIRKVTELIEPIFIGYGDFNYQKKYPLTRVTGKRALPKEWQRYRSRGDSDYLAANLPSSFKLGKVAFGPIYSYARSRVDDDAHITNLQNPLGSPVTFSNGHLLEKELIGIGNGIKRSFSIPRGHSPVYRVFLSDVSRFVEEGQRVPADLKVHPVRDLEGQLRNEYNIQKNILTFERQNKQVRLRLPREAFDEVGKIRYRSSSVSAFASHREIEEIYLEYLGRARKLDENQFRINDREGAIYILDSDIYERVWVEAGITDGVRRSYSAPVNIGENVYLDGRVTDARVVPGQVVFTSTPAAGQEIHVMVLKPRLYAKKNPPGYRVGVYIDKDVKALAIDLGRVFPTPSYGLIVSEVPLLVYGTPARPFTIISTEDVYLSDINRDNFSANNFVAIISRGMVWGQRANKSIQLNRTIVFSEADGLYLNISSDPFVGTYGEAEKSVFLGSLFLQGSLKNLYYYPDLDVNQAYYYHPGQQADFNFFYDESMQEESLLPVFLPTSFRVVKRSF